MIKSRSKLQLWPKIKLTALYDNGLVKSETRKPVQAPQIMMSSKYIGLNRKKEGLERNKFRKTGSRRVSIKKPRKSLESENKYQKSSKKLFISPYENNFEVFSTKNSSKTSGSESKTQRSSKRQLLVPPSEVNIGKISNRDSINGTRSQFHSKRSSNRQLALPSSEVNFDRLSAVGGSKSSRSDNKLQRTKRRQLVLPSSEVNADEMPRENKQKEKGHRRNFRN